MKNKGCLRNLGTGRGAVTVDRVGLEGDAEFEEGGAEARHPQAATQNWPPVSQECMRLPLHEKCAQRGRPRTEP